MYRDTRRPSGACPGATAVTDRGAALKERFDRHRRHGRVQPAQGHPSHAERPGSATAIFAGSPPAMATTYLGTRHPGSRLCYRPSTAEERPGPPAAHLRHPRPCPRPFRELAAGNDRAPFAGSGKALRHAWRRSSVSVRLWDP